MQKKKVTPFVYSGSLESQYERLVEKCIQLEKEKEKDQKRIGDQAKQIVELLTKIALLEKYEKAKRTTIKRRPSLPIGEAVQDMFVD